MNKTVDDQLYTYTFRNIITNELLDVFAPTYDIALVELENLVEFTTFWSYTGDQ